ncbi:MAG: hypothetical protein CL398_00230 [Acidiferrobacteraceae bacterium]|nr:hypothetical protein [Acidiferrobacteraceae bacterium]
MSNFDYHYSKGDKYPADDVINNLRDANDATKAEAVDWLIDKGFLHSDELYNAAYMLAMADAVGISYDGKYSDEDDECQCVGVCTCDSWNSEDEDYDPTTFWRIIGLTELSDPLPKPETLSVGPNKRPLRIAPHFPFYDWSLPQLRLRAEKLREICPTCRIAEEEYLEYYDTTSDWPQPISWRDWMINALQEEDGAHQFSLHGAEDDKPVGNPKRLGRGVDWRPHEDNYLPSQHDRMRAEAYRGYSYERPMFMKVLGLGLVSAFAIALLKIDSDKTEDTNE